MTFVHDLDIYKGGGSSSSLIDLLLFCTYTLAGASGLNTEKIITIALAVPGTIAAIITILTVVCAPIKCCKRNKAKQNEAKRARGK